MAVHSLKTVQKIPVSPELAWSFFSNPANLQTITPGDMGFKIISKHHGEKIYAGQIIIYKLSPFPGIPLYWVTEITQVQDCKYFVDEQRKGPYSLWHHQHHFKEIENGVEMTDLVHYKIPLGLIGKIAHHLFIKNKLRKIFEYRFNKIEELFGTYKGQRKFV